MAADSSLAAGIAALLRCLFDDLQEVAVDDDAVQYLAAGLAETDEDDPDELCDSVAGFSPVFGRLAPPKQRQLIADLLSRVAALRQEQQGDQQSAAAGRPAAKASVAAVAAEALARLGSLSVSSSAASSEREGSEDELGAPLSEAQRQALGTLRELCALPDACDAFLAHVLAAKGGGDVEAAAVWMLEQPDWAAAQASWQVARAARREERARARAEREVSKREIVDRFQLQALPNGSSTSGKGKPPVLKAWGAGGSGGGSSGGGESKARYRDGALVSTRGEKYVFEKGPEWDGGSRGKVYTKGKRGKGFVVSPVTRSLLERRTARRQHSGAVWRRDGLLSAGLNTWQMVRPRPGTHRNPGRRPPGLRQEGAAAAAPEEEAAAAATQQASAEASGSEDGPVASQNGPVAAEASGGSPAAALPLPHVPPNHHTRGKRPSGLVLPRDVHHSIDGTLLPAPTSEGEAAASAEAAGDPAAAAAASGAPRLAAGRLPPGEISFHTLCAFATSVAKCKGAGCMERKRRRVVKFMEEVVARESGDAWAIWRLLLPHFDNHRGPYNLKEKALGNVLIHVCGLGDDTVEANKIRHWIKPGKKGAGDFARVLLENVFRVYCLSDASREKELKVREVNAELDALAAAALLRGVEATDRRCQILRRLLTRCTPEMAFYLAQIILRELKINLSQEYAFRWWHADAQQLFNCTTSAAAVFNTLTDPGKRISPTLAPGRPAAPQLSMPLHSTEAVVDMMRKQGEEAGGELSFLIEPKLNGERQQVHILGPDRPCQYWSRSGIDHGQLRNANTPGPPGGFCLFDSVLRQQVVPQQCILDGELLVWNKKRNNFEVFGSLRSTILAGHANEDPHFRVDCEDFDGNINTADPEWEAPCLGDLEVVYLPWDVLYLDRRCVCHLPLLERRELLRRAVRDAPPEGYPLSPNGVLRGRVVPMLPGQPLLGHVAAPCLCSTSEDVLEAVRGAIRRHEEGIVVKSLPSQWLAGDRNGQWVKIKPDYLSRVEIDALIIGCFWGEDRRAGLFSEFLMGIAAQPPAGKTAPERWISFCKVGSGFTDVDRERLHNALKDNVCERPPPCYEITGSSKETPHFWVKDPLQSVVLEVQADLRLIKSRIYAAEYSLRFPRMERIREPWDKDALGTSTERELRDFVAERKGHLARDDAKQLRSPGKAGPRKARQAAKRRPKGHKLPKAIAGVDVGQVVAESSVLEGCCVCELLLKLGGRPWETYSPGCDRITHVLAGEPGKGSGWRAAARAGCDIISLAWLQRCAQAGQRLEPRPSEYLQLSAATLQSRPDWDCWGDSLFEEATAEDVAALLRRLPDAASLAPLLEQQEAAQERQRRQGQHLWQRQRQRKRQEQEGKSEQQSSEQQDGESSRSSSSEDSGQQAAGGRLAGCSVAFVSLPPAQEAPAVSSTAQLTGLAQLQAAAARSHAALGQWTATCCRGLPQALLQAVSDQCGGPAAVVALQRRLQAGALAVLPHRWLQDLAAAAQNSLPAA
ncbi:DNA ligase 4 [Chlorella sorokiniana]|uniref:DNA ligase 4 n=1 Tax=Chlorella sorokiniana TaxID=3076 RepID=A0A2P6TGS2_CHLSO|nr:DNA ligase 4 [Chlorella sorokiniana]|eukprot:PRW33324.1 DNA ligase 4 [Chlorella sorokiniana]